MSMPYQNPFECGEASEAFAQCGIENIAFHLAFPELSFDKTWTFTRTPFLRYYKTDNDYIFLINVAEDIPDGEDGQSQFCVIRRCCPCKLFVCSKEDAYNSGFGEFRGIFFRDDSNPGILTYPTTNGLPPDDPGYMTGTATVTIKPYLTLGIYNTDDYAGFQTVDETTKKQQAFFFFDANISRVFDPPECTTPAAGLDLQVLEHPWGYSQVIDDIEACSLEEMINDADSWPLYWAATQGPPPSIDPITPDPTKFIIEAIVG